MYQGQFATRLLAVLVCAAAAGASVPAAAEGDDEGTLWAGHQVVVGQKRVPVLGAVDTRTETFFIAKLVPTGSGYEVFQHTCRIRMEPRMGVEVRMPDETARRIPVVPYRLVSNSDGWFYAPPWRAGWQDDDLDRDGQPGATLRVEAPLCSGALYVGSTSWMKARARPVDGAWEGELRVRVEQRALGADSRCLSLMAGDDDDQLRGSFRMVRVPSGTTCDSLDGRPWPTESETPQS